MDGPSPAGTPRVLLGAVAAPQSAVDAAAVAVGRGGKHWRRAEAVAAAVATRETDCADVRRTETDAAAPVRFGGRRPASASRHHRDQRSNITPCPSRPLFYCTGKRRDAPPSPRERIGRSTRLEDGNMQPGTARQPTRRPGARSRSAAPLAATPEQEAARDAAFSPTARHNRTARQYETCSVDPRRRTEKFRRPSCSRSLSLEVEAPSAAALRGLLGRVCCQ